MRRLLLPLLLVALAGCGLDAASTAATSAELKKRELEAARETLDKAREQINTSTQQAADRAQTLDDAEK